MVYGRDGEKKDERSSTTDRRSGPEALSSVCVVGDGQSSSRPAGLGDPNPTMTLKVG